jgi:hypothetical protein
MSDRQLELGVHGLLNFRAGQWRDESSQLYRPAEDAHVESCLRFAAGQDGENAIAVLTGVLRGEPARAEYLDLTRQVYRVLMRESWAEQWGLHADLMAELNQENERVASVAAAPAMRVAATAERRGSRRVRKARRARQARAQGRRS